MGTTAPQKPRLVSKGMDGVRFASRRESLRLVKTPRYYKYSAAGQKIGEDVGQAVEFRDNELVVPTKGKMRLADNRMADAAEILEWLQDHPLLDDRENGFFVVAAVAPPITEGELRVFVDLALDRDEEKIVELIEQEKAGWGRESLIETAEKTLGRVREANAAQANADANAAQSGS